jgi:hypothetical protein
MSEMGIVKVIVDDKNKTPFLPPIEDETDNRFFREAEAEITGLDKDGWPTFQAKNGKRLLVQYIINNESANPAGREVQIFSWQEAVKDDLKRGRIAVDQVGWSIYKLFPKRHFSTTRMPNGFDRVEVHTHYSWKRVERARFRYRPAIWPSSWLMQRSMLRQPDPFWYRKPRIKCDPVRFPKHCK